MPDPVDRLNTALEGRYVIERELGEGGMATVYLAADLRHERKVAVKVLKPDLAAVVGAERFLAEIKTTANLQHPHILPLFDSGEADGFLFYVMPFVEGETLRDRLDREHQLPVAEAVALAQAVTSALDYAHRHDVIHRDVKPANILLHDGNPVVSDFGIALAVSAAGVGRMTETGISLGTAHYMSPEQASADRVLDARSDVYSLACVLFEMLAGDPPHTGPSSQSILVRILTEEPQSVTGVRKSVPPHVAAAVAKGLEKLPADRFDTAAEFGRALGDEGFTHVTTYQATGGGADLSQDGMNAGTPWFADMRSRAAMFALLIAAVLLSLDSFTGDPEVGAGRFVNPVTLFEVDLGNLAVPAQLALSPDGSLLVFASQAPGEAMQLYARRSDESVIRPVPGTQDASEPSFSPDGDWIAFVANGIELKRIPVDGGAPVSVTTLRPAISAPEWDPDGSILFAGQQGLYRVPFGGGHPTQILATSLFSSRTPRHLPGAKSLLFTHLETASTDPEIRLLDLESGEVEFLTLGRDARYLRTGHLIYASLEGSMVARAFDPGRGEFTGPATPIIDDVAISQDLMGLHFALAESGTAVYAVGTSNQLEETLVTVDLEGKEAAIRGLPMGNFSAPRFDPTGRYLAFDLEGSLWVRDLLLGSQSLLHEAPSYNPVWSADGSKIAYGYTLPMGTGTQLLIRNSSLADPPEQLVESPNFLAPSAWYPDGSALVFGEFMGPDGSGAEIWTTNTDPPGTPEPYLRADGWDQGFASLSPDGRWAAYESDEGGRVAVYVRTFPDPSERIKVSEGGGLGARWSADGRRIFYRNGDTIKAANVRTEPTFEVVSNEALFTGPYGGVDPHPDGTSVVVIKRNGAGVGRTGDRHLYFVVNWLDGVRARLGGSR